MKRPSRIALTCVATTGAFTGAAFTISAIAAAGSSSAAAAVTGPVMQASSAAERTELQRQSQLLRFQIGGLEKAIAVERLQVRPSASVSPRAATGYAQVPARTPAPVAPVSAAPAPAWSAPRYVAATSAPVAAAPVATPSIPAPIPPPVHATTGASGAKAGGTEPPQAGSDD